MPDNVTAPELVAATRIVAGDDRTRYDGFAIALHWATALLVVLLFALAHTWGFADRPTRHTMIVAHMSLGILLTAIIVVRIAWRLMPGHQVSAANSGLVELASKAVHYLLYAMLAVQAVLGFVLRWSGNEAMSFFGLQIPPLIPQVSRDTNHFIGDVHNYIGWAIIVIAGAHAAAALLHHYALRDDVLWRMLPGAHARRMTLRAPAPKA
jgi:cytochrome b561